MASRIKGLTLTLSADTTSLEKSLKGVNTTIRSTQTELKDVEKLLKLDPSNTELLAQKQRLLKDAIGATKDKLETLKTAQEQAKQQLENGTLGQDKYDALQREIEETEQALRNLESQVSTTYAALEKIDETGKKFEKAGDTLAGVGKTLTTTVTGPVVALGTAAVKTTADFDAQMSKVQAISGATGEDLQALRDKAREMGAKTKFSATEAGEAMEYMGMAGWKTGDMIDGLEGIMNLAAASGEDLGTTSDIVTDALTAFGLTAKDSGHFADVLAAASTNANTNVSMLGESFKYAAPVAGALGISAEDTSVALGLMANAGIKSSQAGTALRTGLTNLAKPTKQMKQYMDKYNIALVENDDGSINLRETMKSLREKMGGLSESEQAAAASAIFGKNSMAGWLSIINASDGDFEKLTGAIDNCDGTAQTMAETMQDNLSGQLTILKSQLEELAISFGDILMPIVRKVVAAVQGFVDKLNNMSDSQKEAIVKVLALAAAIGPLLLVVGKMISTTGKAMQGFASLGKGIVGLGAKMKSAGGITGMLGKAIGALTSPIGIVIGVVAVLAAAFVHLWKTNEEFRNKVKEIWEKVKSIFSSFVDGIKKRLDDLGINFSTVTGAIKKVWDGFCNLLAPVFIAAFEIISTTLETILGVITGLFDVFAGIFTGDWEQAWT
ncbi:MAG: phage tail tape measure protein, partial [Oscillospiraceae bacterium]|nr:phage tail tape measure protein [Oscillospiraceae bacterium]